MTIEIPTTEPAELRAGDTWQWRREDLSDYPASSWTLTYYFRNKTAHFDVTATADGDAFAVEVAKATTAARAVGQYDWFASVTDGADRFEVARGRLSVLADYSVAAALDGRSFSRKMLDYIEAALLNRATSDQLDLINTTLASRSLTRDRAGMITLRDKFRAEVRAEENQQRIRDGKPSRYRMVVVG